MQSFDDFLKSLYSFKPVTGKRLVVFPPALLTKIHINTAKLNELLAHITCVSEVHIKGRPRCLPNVSTNVTGAPTHTCASHVCVGDLYSFVSVNT